MHQLTISADNCSAENYKRQRAYIGSQAEVADLLGITRYAIIRRESGAVKIRPEHLLALSAIRARQTANCA